MTLNWNISLQDSNVVRAIVDRASMIQPSLNRGLLTMDLTAVHCNGTPLDLDALLGADSFEFAHDVSGIDRHLDRRTGKLGDCFVPRFALRQTSAA